MAKLARIAPEVPVSDLRASLEYYEQKLGFEIVAEMPDSRYAIVERDGIAIHLFEEPKPKPVGMHIFTNELEGLYTEMEGRGARVSQGIIRQPWGNRDFRVKDVSGNEIKFTEPLGGRGQPGS